MNESQGHNTFSDALVKAVHPIPIPTNPLHFLGTFLFANIDDETGQLDAVTQHNDRVGRIPLATRLDKQRGIIVLEGTMNPDTHPFFKIPFEYGNNGGMTCVVKCSNNHQHANGFDIWKRSLTKQQMKSFEMSTESTLTLAGHAPGVPYGQGDGKAILTFDERKGHFYVQSVKIELTFKVYEAWIWSITH